MSNSLADVNYVMMFLSSMCVNYSVINAKLGVCMHVCASVCMCVYVHVHVHSHMYKTYQMYLYEHALYIHARMCTGIHVHTCALRFALPLSVLLLFKCIHTKNGPLRISDVAN